MNNSTNVLQRITITSVIIGLSIVLTAGFFACKSMPNNQRSVAQAEMASNQLVVVAPEIRANNQPKVLVHYMPWYQAPPTSKSYGWHWHMGFYDPYEVDSNGKSPIATHFYPLTGPYDSADPAILEYQLCLMKISGIDGVIIDWYGIGDALDYPLIHAASQKLFAAVKKAGMYFAVCYEDQSIGKMVEAKSIVASEAVSQAQKTFAWMEQNWFNNDCYVKVEGRPLVLDFGPQYIRSQDQWSQVFSGLTNRPFFVSLDNHAEGWADGFYAWPPMWMNAGGELSPSQLVNYFTTFYRKTDKQQHLVTSAFPGFKDIYYQAKVGPSYGFLNDAGGKILSMTLNAAISAKPEVIQIATWNDYGEGTIVEPNEIRGYRDLEIIQTTLKKELPTLMWNAGDLRLPLEVFKQRRSGANAALDAVVAAILTGKPEAARAAAKAAGIAPSK